MVIIAPGHAHGGRLVRLARYVRDKSKKPLAVISLVAAGAGYFEYTRTFPSVDSAEQKKKVLVIPFNRLDLKDKHTGGIESLKEIGPETEDRPIRLEVKELVDLIHSAAADPNIVCLYGIFGHGSTLPSAGWADLEEVRNALKVFREVHRAHSEPNFGQAANHAVPNESKPLYAYTDTFSSLTDPGNKEYYLASIFTHLHLQQNGELNLFGMMTQQLFLRELLDKHGVKLHVFKQGKYKNFPNMFTEKKFTIAHKENVKNILEGINASACSDITASRSMALLDSWLMKTDESELWRRIHQSGTFPSMTAWTAGFVDFLPRRDPLEALLKYNQNESDSGTIQREWRKEETDFARFKAEKAISLSAYSKQLKKKEVAAERKRFWANFLSDHPTMKSFLTSFGVVDEKIFRDAEKRGKIALLYVQGGIDDKLSRKTVNAIRKIGKDEDTKCVVVRVCSPGGSIFACETISEELKGLGVPVVVSFGNVAASGGYYISSAANRVFASHKTITGSIGVFGVRPDLTGLAAQYGVRAEHIVTGDLAAFFSPLHPMSKRMKKNMSECIDRYYDQFKTVVSVGRNLSMEEVEKIAQGRVWTGDQAKLIGLVDEIGGLSRALAYAKRTFTEGCDAEVVVWPKKQRLLDQLREATEANDVTLAISVLLQHLGVVSSSKHHEDPTVTSLHDGQLIRQLSSGQSKGTPCIFYAMDEEEALRSWVDGFEDGSITGAKLPPPFWF